MAIEYRTDPDFVEYLDGTAFPKVSPRIAHGAVQLRLAQVLAERAGKRGIVGTEIDAVVGRADGTASKFVPDVSYISYERYRTLAGRDREFPPFAPDVAIEVRSTGDRPEYLAKKFARYLATGALLVLDADMKTRTIAAHEASGTRVFREHDRFTSVAVPWFTFDVRDVFSVLDDIPSELREP